MKESFILYYFTTRPDIRPSEAGQFTQADKEALIAQYKRFEAFIVKYFDGVERANAARDGEWTAALEAFISAENPTDAPEDPTDVPENPTDVPEDPTIEPAAPTDVPSPSVPSTGTGAIIAYGIASIVCGAGTVLCGKRRTRG